MSNGYEKHNGDTAKVLDDDGTEGFTLAEQRGIIRRIDLRLVSTVGLMYCISLLDRTNLGNAVIAGMDKELRLIGYRYNIITLVFFTTYTVFQPPATVLTRKIGPRIFLPTITLFWGFVMIGMGFVKRWDQLAGLRVILGLFEAGFFPGCVYLLSTWYHRYDMGKRYAFFYLIGSVAAACGGILAYGIMQMDGVEGKKGWRWIFIIEGILTCIISVIGYVFLVDFPDQAKNSWHFLNEREVRFIINRVNRDRGDAVAEPFDFRKWASAGLDLKIWGFALIFFAVTTKAYAIAYFLPVILRLNMGFSVAASQCLVAPPYATSGILMIILGWIGDKYHIRGPLIVFNAVLAFIGLFILAYHPIAGVRYFGVFLLTAGTNANVPMVLSYQANNIRGQWKRAFCSATLVGFGGIGGIAGSLIFRSQDSPGYRPGIYGCLACAVLIILMVGVLSVKFYFDNAKQARGELVIEESEQGFRYTY